MQRLKTIYQRAGHNTTLDIIQGRKPETFDDLTQVFLTSLLENGINLSMPVHCIRAHSKAIVYVTKTGKEQSAILRAHIAIENALKRMQNGVATITKTSVNPETGKRTRQIIPVLSLANLDSGTDFKTSAYYWQDFTTEQSIKAEQVTAIKAATKPAKQADYIGVYTLLVDGYKQSEISTALNMPTSTINRTVKAIRDVIANMPK